MSIAAGDEDLKDGAKVGRKKSKPVYFLDSVQKN